jgi:hypothetical protein
VAKKRSAGAVQQNRSGLIGLSFDVKHRDVVKEERLLERPGDWSRPIVMAFVVVDLPNKTSVRPLLGLR